MCDHQPSGRSYDCTFIIKIIIIKKQPANPCSEQSSVFARVSYDYKHQLFYIYLHLKSQLVYECSRLSSRCCEALRDDPATFAFYQIPNVQLIM